VDGKHFYMATEAGTCPQKKKHFSTPGE